MNITSTVFSKHGHSFFSDWERRFNSFKLFQPFFIALFLPLIKSIRG